MIRPLGAIQNSSCSISWIFDRQVPTIQPKRDRGSLPEKLPPASWPRAVHVPAAIKTSHWALVAAKQ